MEFTTEQTFKVAELITDIEIAGLQVKKHTIKYKEKDVRAAHEAAMNLAETANKLVTLFEDLEMDNLDVDVDGLFVDNLASDYVKAVIEVLSGDKTAGERMEAALAKLEAVQQSEECGFGCGCEFECKAVKSVSLEELLEEIEDEDEAHFDVALEFIEEIEKRLEGRSTDTFGDVELELARYVLRFNPDVTPREIDDLTPFGVKLAWNRRILLGATK